MVAPSCARVTALVFILGGKAWTWLSIYANGIACLASMLALVAIALWTYGQGDGDSGELNWGGGREAGS